MRTGCMFFLLGILLLLSLPELPPIEFLYLLPVCLAAGIRFSGLCWLAYFVCGGLWALFHADLLLENQLPKELEGKNIIVEGKIVSLPVKLERGWRFVLKVEELLDETGQRQPFKAKIRLNWYIQDQEVLPGESWRLSVRLKRPNGFMNPGGFDYEGWLFQQGIRATGYVYNRGPRLRTSKSDLDGLNDYRYQLKSKLDKVLKDDEKRGLIPALVIGDRSGIPADTWQVLTSTGTSHLLAISGLHIGLVAGIAYFLFRWLWPLGLILPAPNAAAFAAIAAALVYAALAGFAIPTQRALIMLLVLIIGKLVSRKLETSWIICLALLLVLLLDPFSVLSPGFWLSFGAISVITYGMSARVNITGFWWRWGRVQYLVALGLAPVLVLWFNQVPVWGLLANMIVVPWVSSVTVPLVLLGTIMLCFNDNLASMLLDLALLSIQLAWPILLYLKQLPVSTLSAGFNGVIALPAAIIGVAIMLLPAGVPARWLGGLWFLPLFFPLQDTLKTGELRLTLLDVGQGTAVLVRTSSQAMLYDTGPRFSSRFDAGSAVIIPYIRREAIQSLDLLVQSHGDNDHIGGLAALLENVKIASIISSVPGQIEGRAANFCVRGEKWNWDQVNFEILHPQRNSDLSGNDASCVIKISGKFGSILLTGDIESEAERRILARDGDRLSSTVLLVPHHGSRTSSSRRFIGAVTPELAVFTTAYRNRFGFPKKDIIQRYTDVGSMTLDTAINGAVDVKLVRDGIEVVTSRQSNRRFWNRKEE